MKKEGPTKGSMRDRVAAILKGTSSKGLPFVDRLLREKETDEDTFQTFVDHYFEMLGGRRTIVGIGDQVMPDSLIDRVKYIAQKVETYNLKTV